MFALLLIALIALCGCVENAEVISLAKSQPAVQEFLAENPGAEIVVVFLDKESVKPFLNSIREKCGEQMQEIPYWYVTVTEGDKKLEVYLDGTGKQALCVTKPVLETLPEPPSGQEPPPAQQDECSTATQCNDNNPCTADACIGTPKECTNTQITSCTGSDECCPSGCTAGNDNDCGVVKNCPLSCADNNPCTSDYCNESTGFECAHSNLSGSQTSCSGSAGTCLSKTCQTGQCIQQTVAGCCGNRECEAGESYDNCPADCEQTVVEGRVEEGEFIENLEGKGTYALGGVKVKFNYLALLDYKRTRFKAWVQLYSNNGILISNTLVEEDDDLSEKFVNSSSQYALRDRVIVKGLVYDSYSAKGYLDYEIRGKNEGECQGCSAPIGAFYGEGNTITGVEGKGGYDGSQMSIKFIDLVISSPVDSSFDGWFELYDHAGNLVDRKYEGGGTDLSNVFEHNGGYAIKTRVNLKEVFNTTDLKAFVLLEKTGGNSESCSPSVCKADKITYPYYPGDWIPGLTGAGQYTGQELSLKVNNAGWLSEMQTEDYFQVEIVLFNNEGVQLEKETFQQGEVALQEQFPFEEWRVMKGIRYQVNKGWGFVIVEQPFP